MAEQLGAMGEVISERTLLHVIRGLNEWFKNIGMHLRRGHPFPTFLEARPYSRGAHDGASGTISSHGAGGLRLNAPCALPVSASGWHRLRGCPCFIVQEPPQQARWQKRRLWIAVAAEWRASLQRPARQPDDRLWGRPVALLLKSLARVHPDVARDEASTRCAPSTPSPVACATAGLPGAAASSFIY